MTNSKEKLLRDLEGFAAPSCPDCTALGEPTIDEHGYFCARCGKDLPNGFEFDEIIKELAIVEGRS